MGLSNSTPQLPITEDPAFDHPWRPVNWSNREEILRKLREIEATQGVDQLRILFVGPTASGKTTFIDSFDSAIKGRITCLTFFFNNDLHPNKKYNFYKLKKDTDGSLFPFTFGDTTHLAEDSNGIDTDDIINIIQGRVQEGHPFNNLDESNDFNKAPSLNDKVHCLVFFLPADKLSEMSEGIFDKMKLVLHQARELGIPQVVIMSRVDRACSLVSEDLKRIYESKKIKAKMEECHSRLGVPVQYIFPVKNYDDNIDTNVETDILILTAVTNIVNFANDFVRREVDL